MMQSPEAQYQLALKMPMDRLIGILQGRPDAVVGQPIAMMALKALKEQKTAFQGQQAQAQLQQPNVKDQLLAEDQGIATYPADNMGGFEESGIVGYAGGGGVQHFFGEGQVRGSYDYSDYYTPIRGSQKTKEAFREPEQTRDPLDFIRGIAPTLLGGTREVREQEAREREIDRLYGPNQQNSQPPAASGYAGYAPAPKAAPRLRSQADPGPRVTTNQQNYQPSAFPPAAGYGAALAGPQQEQRVEPSRAGIEAALPPAQQTDLTSYEDMLRKSQAVTPDYKTQITDLVKQMTASPAEKDRERESRLGTGLLSIASDLLEPGQTSSGARGKAFKTIAGLASQYSKEDKADKRANIGFELSTRMGIAQLEQGDRKNATDLFNHAQTLLVQQADMAGKRAMHLSEMNAKERGFSIEETKIRNEKAYHDAYIDVLRDGNKIKERLGVRGIAAEETRAAAVEQRERAANLRTYVDAIKAELAGTPTAARRKALQEQLDGLTRSIGSELGIAGATPRPIQIPDTAGGRGAKIHDLE